MREFLKPKRLRDAGHYIVDYRIAAPNGIISGYKNNGYRSPSKENVAGVMMMEIMRRRKMVNRCVWDTRWCGGIRSGGDRFGHVRQAAKAILDRV